MTLVYTCPTHTFWRATIHYITKLGFHVQANYVGTFVSERVDQPINQPTVGDNTYEGKYIVLNKLYLQLDLPDLKILVEPSTETCSLFYSWSTFSICFTYAWTTFLYKQHFAVVSVIPKTFLTCSSLTDDIKQFVRCVKFQTHLQLMVKSVQETAKYNLFVLQPWSYF